MPLLRRNRNDRSGSFPGITAPQHCCPLPLNQRTLRPASGPEAPERGHLIRWSWDRKRSILPFPLTAGVR